MAAEQADLADLIATTLRDMPEKDQFEVTWENNAYEAARIYQEDRLVIDGGTAIERKVIFDNSGNARYRKVYDTDTPTVNQIVHTILVPWCLVGSNWSWDEFELINQKNSVKGFISLLKLRRLDGLWALATLLETRLWLNPTSATDNTYPFGIPYYLNVKNAAGAVNATAGFVGATIDYQGGSTGTICAGIDANTEANWRNYAALYTEVNNSLLKAFRKAFMLTQFKAPIFVNDPNDKSAPAKRIYTGPTNVSDLMDLADRRDDNITGKEVLGNLRVDDGGLVTINRLPVVPINALESASYSPIYCVDLTKLIPIVHDGYWMKETQPMTSKGQHTSFTIYVDGAHQNLCINRRAIGFVMHKAS